MRTIGAIQDTQCAGQGITFQDTHKFGALQDTHQILSFSHFRITIEQAIS